VFVASQYDKRHHFSWPDKNIPVKVIIKNALVVLVDLIDMIAQTI